MRISADLADIKQGLGLLRGELAKVKKDAGAALQNAGNNAAIQGIKRVRQEVAGLAAAWLSLRGASVLSGLADEATQLRGRIRMAKGDYEGLFSIAQDTRTGLTNTVDLYARMERSSRGMQLSQERLLGLTRTVNQAIRLSFASAAAGDAAIVQFGQALAAGQLRGEELNSVLEQTPRLAEAIATGMGIPLGKLRELAKEGKLTNEQVLKALESQASAVEKEFGQMPVTIGDALVQVRNAFLDFVGDVDEAEGISRKLATALTNLAKDLPRYLGPVLTLLRLIIQNLDVILVIIGTRLALAAAAAIPALIAYLVSLRAALVAATAQAVTLRGALALLGGPVGLAIAALTGAVYALYQRTQDATRAQEAHNAELAANRDLAKESAQAALADARAKRAQAISTLQAALAVANERKERLAAERARQERRGGRGGYLQGGVVAAVGTGVEEAQSRVDQLARMVDDWNTRVVDLGAATAGAVEETVSTAAAGTGKAIAASNALLRDATERALKELERIYGEGRLSIKDYFAERERLQLRAVDLAIQQAQAELAVADKLGPRRKLEEEIATLQRDRAEIGVRSAREQARAEQDLAAQVADLKRQLGDVFDIATVGQAERARVLREYEVLFRRLEAESGAAGEQMGQALVERLVARAQQDALGEAATKIGAALRSIETAIGAQVGAGTMGMGEGERQLAAARAKALADYQQLRAAAVGAMAAHAPGSPAHTAAVAGLRELDTEIANVIASQDTWRQKTEDLAANSLGDALADLITGAKGFKEAFSDMVRSFVAGVARMIAQELALRAVRGLFSGFGGGATADVHHQGGVAGQGAVRRSISPLLFGAAPRYHNGGIAGLAPDEVPAILRRDEEVVTRSDPRHRANGGLGSGRGGNYRIEIVNTGPPMRATETTITQQPDGTQLIRTVLEAVADDVANGGVVAAAGRGRFGWKDQV
ncbi:hypothetical protein WQ56_00585 [Luteimonas sp. FCS-9]|nr:hypothetical protein WQ56_00585 [Luteimonas sp. FCS-9]